MPKMVRCCTVCTGMDKKFGKRIFDEKGIVESQKTNPRGKPVQCLQKRF